MTNYKRASHGTRTTPSPAESRDTANYKRYALLQSSALRPDNDIQWAALHCSSVTRGEFHGGEAWKVEGFPYLGSAASFTAPGLITPVDAAQTLIASARR